MVGLEIVFMIVLVIALAFIDLLAYLLGVHLATDGYDDDYGCYVEMKRPEGDFISRLDGLDGLIGLLLVAFSLGEFAVPTAILGGWLVLRSLNHYGLVGRLADSVWAYGESCTKFDVMLMTLGISSVVAGWYLLPWLCLVGLLLQAVRHDDTLPRIVRYQEAERKLGQMAAEPRAETPELASAA